MKWELHIDEIPPSGNVTKRMHWAAYQALVARWYLLIRCSPGFLDIPPATGKRKLTIYLHGRNTRDRENLFFSTKPVVDVLKFPKHEEGFYKSGKRLGEYWSRKRIGHGLIQEDDPSHLTLDVIQLPRDKTKRPFLQLVLED